MKRRRSLISLAAAAALIVAGCSQPETQAFVDVPPIDETIRTAAVFPEDGLSHFIVTPIAGAPGSTVEDSVDGEPVDEAPDESWFLTPGMVAGIPPGASLEARDGLVGYVDELGEFVVIEGAPPAAPPTTEPEPAPTDDEPVEIVMAYGNPYIDALAADPAVESVIVIGDGTFGVSVRDPEVIDTRIFAIVEDVPFGTTTDQYEPLQWALENDGTNLQTVTTIDQVEDADVDITPTLDRADGKGIVVAVIDSGVDFSHPDLANSAWSNLGEVCGNGLDDEGNGYVDDCTGWDFGTNDATPYNEGADPHGTHVSGIITANRDGRGVVGGAPDARIMDLNVARRTADGDSISGASVTAAIRYAVDNGADIINMSLGSQPGTSAAAVAPMAAAIDYAASNGVIVVAAAGNNGVDLGSLPVYPASFDRPNMIVVGASSPADTRADFSNYNADIVDVYAPGELILSTVPGNDFRFMSGTSQASPLTAAAVALVMQTNPDSSMADVIDAVAASVDQADAFSTSVAAGRINVATALGANEANGAPSIPIELDVRVSGIHQTSNEVNATIEITTPPEIFDEEYRWELSLVVTDDNGAYAVIDHPFMVDGGAVSTGENGAVPLAPAEATTVAVGTTLPAGRYSFIIEAVPTADASFRLGDAFVTTFEIPGDPETPVDTTPPTTVAPPTTVPAESEPTDDAVPDGVGNGDGVDSTTPDDGSPDEDAESTDSTQGDTSAGSTPSTPDGSTPGAGGSSTTAPVEPSDGGSSATTPTTGVPTTSAVDGGGSPTTTPGAGSTTPPTTTPGAGSTTPTPGGPPSVPSDVGTGQAKKGAWESTSVSPQAGYVNLASTVTIRGNFPSDTYVWFGGQPGQVVHQNRSQITVRTPLRAEPGVVDITLQKSPTGVVLTIPDAFAFVAHDASTGEPDNGSGSDGAGNGGSTSDGAAGGSDGSPGGDGTDDGTTSDDTAGGSDSGGDEASSSDRRARMLVGSPVPLSNGLQGGSVTPNLAAGVPVCSADPCSSTRR